MTEYLKRLQVPLLTVVFPAIVLGFLAFSWGLVVFSGKAYAAKVISEHPAIIQAQEFMIESKSDRVGINQKLIVVQDSIGELTRAAQVSADTLKSAALMQVENAKQIAAIIEQNRALHDQLLLERIDSKDRDTRIENRLNSLSK